MAAGPILAGRALDGLLGDRLAEPPGAGLRLHWLGQAGFVIDADGRRIVIDPYLSDSLHAKYRDTPRPHRRMMPVPVAPDAIRHVDLVACTHGHTDHMDPGTLPALLAANPNALLLAPRAMRALALERSGIGAGRLLDASAGERIVVAGIAVTATRAAHEALEVDAAGDHRFLGYAFELGDLRLWHSGDCIPFAGLVEEVAALAPDVALLPVNGRRPDLSANGVPGNFTLSEAIALAESIGCSEMVAHHYGLFAFNTEDPAAIDAAARASRGMSVHRARMGVSLVHFSHGERSTPQPPLSPPPCGEG